MFKAAQFIKHRPEKGKCHFTVAKLRPPWCHKMHSRIQTMPSCYVGKECMRSSLDVKWSYLRQHDHRQKQRWIRLISKALGRHLKGGNQSHGSSSQTQKTSKRLLRLCQLGKEWSTCMSKTRSIDNKQAQTVYGHTTFLDKPEWLCRNNDTST